MTQKETIPKKAPKRVERVERSSAKKRTRSPSEEEEENDERSTKDRRTKSTQRVERSSLKKRARTPSEEEEEESDERNKKERRSNKISCPIPHEKLCRRSKRRRLKGRFSFRSVDFFTNKNNDSQPEPVKRIKKPVLVDVVEDDDRIGMFLSYCHAYLL